MADYGDHPMWPFREGTDPRNYKDAELDETVLQPDPEYGHPKDWGFWRWVKESWRFTRPMPWWQFAPAVVRKWFWFDHQQKLDRRNRP